MSRRSAIMRAQQMVYDEVRADFEAMGTGGRYCRKQKEHALKLIDEYGARAAERILGLPRRTVQRRYRAGRRYVKRCPGWVYSWAAKRRKRREFWASRGIGKVTISGPIWELLMASNTIRKKTTAKVSRKAGSTRTNARAVPCKAGRIQGKRRRPYRVGYCRPPKEYQFKPGQSGNPGGRPVGSVRSPLRRALLQLLDAPCEAG